MSPRLWAASRKAAVRRVARLSEAKWPSTPGVMDPDDYDLSGFTVGVVDRPKMIGPDGVVEGDVLVGLRSSGFHSNGYSLVRKVLVEGKTAEELAAPWPSSMAKRLAMPLSRPPVFT